MYGSVEMTAATSWPWYRTLSVANTAWVSPDRVGIHARLYSASSSPVTTAITPSMASAAEESMPLIVACAHGLRTNVMYSIPGSTMSSIKLPAPWIKRSSSCRLTLWPMPPTSALVIGW